MNGSRFMEKSFSVPASAGSPAYCAEHGHAMPDQRGRCIRCGEAVRFDYARIARELTTTEAAMRGHKA